MKSVALFLALHIFPCTAIGCATYLFATNHPCYGAAMIGLALLTLPRFTSRR